MSNNKSSFAGKFGPYLIFFAAMLWATDAPFRLHLTQDLPSNLIVLVEAMDQYEMESLLKK